jgi:hypothetical protein
MKLSQNIHYALKFINDIDFTLTAALGLVDLETALNTQTGFTIWTPKHCLRFFYNTQHISLQTLTSLQLEESSLGNVFLEA